jgi:hypothetical protein
MKELPEDARIPSVTCPRGRLSFKKIKIKTGNDLDQLEKEAVGMMRRQQGRIDDAWGLQAARQEKRCLMKSR